MLVFNTKCRVTASVNRLVIGYTRHIHDCLLSLQKLFNHSDLQTTINYIGLTEEKNRQLINDHGEFIHNVLAGKGDEIVRNMPVISLKSDDFGKIIRMLTDDVGKYQKAIDMANQMRVL